MSSSSAPESPQENSQKRFSFYNADEYKVGGGSSSPSSAAPQRFHFYNANEIRLTETVLQTVNDEDETTEGEGTGNKMDSTEILKSLQEHEQQRLSILSGTGKEVVPAAEEEEQQQQQQDDDNDEEDTPPPIPAAAIAAPVEQPPTAITTTTQSISPPTTRTSPHSEDHEDDTSRHHSAEEDTDTDTLQSNPYQEAIHEALELLRQKRSPYQQNTAGRQQRQERLQKYSARLQELKQDEILPATSSLSEDEAPAVERVLMAILQSADSAETIDEKKDELLRAVSDIVPRTAAAATTTAITTTTMEDHELQSQDEERDLRRFRDEIATQPSEDSIVGREVEEHCRTRVPESYSDHEGHHSDIDPEESVLGPLGQDTGVVLDDDDDALEHQPSSASCQSEEEADTSEQSFTSSDLPSSATSSSAPTHILDSLSAAVSYMTGGVRSENADDSPKGEEDEEDEEEDTETTILRSLCAHLIPKSNIPRPQWDDSNAEELGYRIVRISNEQLERMEEELQDLLIGFPEDPRDNIVPIETAVVKSPRKSANESNSLEHFPGIKASGEGEMGDLEYFVLPVIYKSHVTGFEPVKDMVLEPGNVLAGQYLVEGVLGSAAFSTAYKCVDLSTNSDVCLKVIKNTKDFFDQSLDEIKILELLRQTGQCHENFIVEMKTFFYHREHLIIVTELLRQNLFEFGKFIMDSGEEPYFTLPRLAYVTRQCLISLRFVHSLGLVHSDVKPENILLSSYSRASVKLIDFGSSCYLTDRQSSYIQSRSYRAPEVCLGLPYDGRIDVWSLGCVVAEMFTGEVTFQNDSIVSMLSRIESICGAFPRHMIATGRQSSTYFTKTGLVYEREEDIDAVDIFQPKSTTLSARLGNPNDEVFLDFIRQLLAIDPELRPTAAQALEHPWMKYAEDLTEDDIVYPQP